MTVTEVKENKKKYLDLLLLADEEEKMIDRYLDRGVMYLMEKDGKVVSECVVTDEGEGVLEIKNLATAPEYQGRGYGKALISFLIEKYRGSYTLLQVGTGDSPKTVSFYEKCGFTYSHTVPNFFLDNYSRPIYEDGVRLVDMIYLRMKI